MPVCHVFSFNCNRALFHYCHAENKNVAKHKDRVGYDDGIQWHSRHCNLLKYHILQKQNPPISHPDKKKKSKTITGQVQSRQSKKHHLLCHILTAGDLAAAKQWSQESRRHIKP